MGLFMSRCVFTLKTRLRKSAAVAKVCVWVCLQVELGTRLTLLDYPSSGLWDRWAEDVWQLVLLMLFIKLQVSKHDIHIPLAHPVHTHKAPLSLQPLYKSYSVCSLFVTIDSCSRAAVLRPNTEYLYIHNLESCLPTGIIQQALLE